MHSKTILIGYVGREPELRYTGNAIAILNVSMATSRKWTGNDGTKKEETTWWRVAIWNKLAESLQPYIHKGSLLYVEGIIRPDEFGNPSVYTKQDGTPAASFELNADVVRLLNRTDASDVSDAPPNANQVYAGQLAGQTEIPF